jgi:hypothetical protein
VVLTGLDDATEIQPLHIAFLVDDATFEAAYSRLINADVAIYADPGRTQPGQTRKWIGRYIFGGSCSGPSSRRGAAAARTSLRLSRFGLRPGACSGTVGFAGAWAVVGSAGCCRGA